jgi:hypothetical protein
MTENENYESTNIPINDAVEESKSELKDIEVIETEDFSYDGYQVVRGEYFAHLFEPSITFNKCKVYLNTACIKKFPNIDYVQILVNSEEKKLAVRPCGEEQKDSFLWCTAKRKPKQISCKIFSGMIADLLGWNLEHRYKLLGKLIKSNDDFLFIFDLRSFEMYERKFVEGSEKQKSSRTPIFPEEWKNQFGLPVEEHKKQLQINLFNGYTVFGIKDETKKTNENIAETTIEEVQNDNEQQ